MPNTHSTLASLFGDIADAIRAKTGGSADIVADEFPTAIAAIPTGGTPTPVDLTTVDRSVTYDNVYFLGSNLTITKEKSINLISGVKYYLITFDTSYDTTSTASGAAYALCSASGSVIASDNSGTVSALTVTKTSTKIKASATVSRASTESYGQHITMAIVGLT